MLKIMQSRVSKTHIFAKGVDITKLTHLRIVEKETAHLI